MVVTAPHPASRAAIARPMPWVDPLTKAVRPVKSISIGYLQDAEILDIAV
jgi:hypothetical protein